MVPSSLRTSMVVWVRWLRTRPRRPARSPCRDPMSVRPVSSATDSPAMSDFPVQSTVPPAARVPRQTPSTVWPNRPSSMVDHSQASFPFTTTSFPSQPMDQPCSRANLSKSCRHSAPTNQRPPPSHRVAQADDGMPALRTIWSNPEVRTGASPRRLAHHDEGASGPRGANNPGCNASPSASTPSARSLQTTQPSDSKAQPWAVRINFVPSSPSRQ